MGSGHESSSVHTPYTNQVEESGPDHGPFDIHEDAEWLRKAVTDLTEAHEASRVVPWEVSDAPESYIEGQLRGIIGLEFTIERIEAKAKLSQNRSEVDQRGVVEGLRKEGKMRDLAIVNRMDEIR